MATSTIYFNRAGITKLDIGTIDFAHYAKVTLKIGNTVIHTSGKLPTNQDYYNWTISESEKAQIMSLLPTNSNSVSCTMKVDVFWSVSDADANLYDREYDVSFVLEETEDTKPTITITGKSPLIYADYVQSKTKLKCTLDASTKNNATVKAVTLTVGGSSCTLVSNNNGSYAFESDLLFRSGTNSIVATITDSRGFKRTISDSIYIHPYAPPILTPLTSEGGLVCRRWRPDTNTFDEMHGTECRVAVNVYTSYVPDILTSYSLFYRYRKTGADAWSEEVLIGTKSIVKTGSTEFIAVISDGTAPDASGVPVGKFSPESEYDIEIRVVDAMEGTHTRYEQLLCQETSFNIKPNGMGAAVGKYATQDKLFDSAWDIHSDGDIEADGDVKGKNLVLDGTEITASAKELNNCFGSTDNLQKQINTLATTLSSIQKNLSTMQSDLTTAKNNFSNYYTKTQIDSDIVGDMGTKWAGLIPIGKNTVEDRIESIEDRLNALGG